MSAPPVKCTAARPAAARSLNPLTPFHEPGFGNHARYLMARIHHVIDEHAEAAPEASSA